jgi:hypothetical protein
MVKTGEVTECGPDGHGDGARHPMQGLEGFDYGAQSPDLDRSAEFLRKTLEAFGVLGDGSDVFLDDELLRWGETGDLNEPSQVGRPKVARPVGGYRVAAERLGDGIWWPGERAGPPHGHDGRS